ncbi:MAG: M56 family metallopeptidase [Bacteroidales bacterium]|nr:M56 family metallopeptidase [Bacteroidales bacterium]
MLNLVIYEAKVALLLAVFYICYRVLLSRETLHRLNRIVLTGSVLVSFILPFCVLTFHRTVEVAAGAAMPAAAVLPAMPALPQGPAATAAAAAAPEAATPYVSWLPVALAIIYCAGILFCLIRIAVELVQVRRIIRSGESLLQEDGTVLVIGDRDIAPFSWMKWIVLSREDYESGNTHILKHERAHIRLGHARDLLIIDLLSSMQWFNPVMWMLKSDLRAVYEYEADDAVLREGANIKEYQYSLIRKAVSASGYSITNSFNHSILKNRITMMSKPKSVTLRGLRALYVIPLVAAGLACNSQTVTDYKVSENPAETKSPDEGKNVILVELKTDDAGEVRCFVDGIETGFGDALGESVSAKWKGDGFDVVALKAESDTPVGFVDDVKNTLRKIQALRIMYSSRKTKEVSRVLPPTPKTSEEAGLTYDPNLAGIPRENIFVVRINSVDKLLYSTSEGKIVVAEDGKAGMDRFVADAAETIRQVEGCVYSFQCDRGTSYNMYVECQNALQAAYDIVREEYSMEKYDKPLDALSSEEHADVLRAVPVRIFEAETKNRPAR